MIRIFVVFLVFSLIPVVAFAADEESELPVEFDKIQWQQAVAEDIHVFDPYIGVFKSGMHESPDGKELFFIIEYSWFDAARTIVKFKITTHIPADGLERLNGEGFYGYDPFNERLYAYGFFPRGISSFGGVAQFNHENFERATRVHTKAADGTLIEIMDKFRLDGETGWKNQTFMSRDGGPWQMISEDTFTRIEE